MAANPAREDNERPRLSKAAVVGRALALADTSGLDTLTIRRLAQELSVTPMALYWHFRSKDELLVALADQVWSEIDVAVDPAAPWPDQLRGLLESLVRVLRAHPAAARLVLSHEKQSEAFRRATEVTLEVLRSAGFGAQYASEIARSALWTGLTLVMSEPGFEPDVDPALSADERAEVQRRKQLQFAMLPVARYPRLVECAAEMTDVEPEFHYQFGIDLFIAGVRAMARR
jgi:TetR/AcrR family transcriptional regulator, tetracycline repressor protein